MALIDVVKWDAPSGVLVWKFPNSELSTLTQLIVNESQSATLFKDGRQFHAFGPGRHTLDTKNIPVLGRLFNIPFGGKSPFAAEVWFCNHAISLDLKWGTPSPLQLEDPQYGVIVPVQAYGQMGARIKSPGKFLTNVVGTLPTFDTQTVLEYFKGVLVSQLKTAIAQAIVNRRIGILQIETDLITLSSDIESAIQPHFEEFGLKIKLFRIMSISVPDDDPGIIELKKAKSTAARRKIEGTTFAQERSFEVLQDQARNEGTGGMAANLGSQLTMGSAMGAMAAQQLAAGIPSFGMPQPPPIMQQPTQAYYAHLNGSSQGPFNISQIQQAVSQSSISADTPMWRQGMAGWLPASQIPEISILFASPPPFPGGNLAPANNPSGPPPFSP